MTINEHLEWLRSEIRRLRSKTIELNNLAKKTGDGDALAQAWICCGAAGSLVACWNHLTGEQRLVEDLIWL